MTLDPPAPLQHGNFFLNGYMIFWRSLHELKKQTMLADVRSDDSPTYSPTKGHRWWGLQHFESFILNLIGHLFWHQDDLPMPELWFKVFTPWSRQ